MHSVVIMINPYEMSQAGHLTGYEGGRTATSGRLHAPAMVISWSEANYAGGEQTKNNQVKHTQVAGQRQKAGRAAPGRCRCVPRSHKIPGQPKSGETNIYRSLSE